MNILTSTPDTHRRYNAELRLFIVSASPKTGPERSALMRTVLPELRQRAGERGVIVTEIDPRWEIASAPGKAREIFTDRLGEMHAYRPVFIGILGHGDRAGAAERSLPWLAGRTDAADRMLAIELIERAVDNELMRGRAFFYILTGNGEGAAPETSEAARKLDELVGRLRLSPLPVCEVTGGIESLCAHIQRDLLAALDRLHPTGRRLSPLEQMRRPHELFAARLRRAYVDIPGYFDRLDAHVGAGAPLMLTGRSGDGKSALLANWAEYRRTADPTVPIIDHYVGAASVRSDHGPVLRHLMAELKDRYGISSPLPETTEELTAAFPSWLAQIGDERLVIIIDGLDNLDPASQDLAWLPGNLDIPANVPLIVSTTHEEAHGRGIRNLLIDRDWDELRVEPLTIRQQQSVIHRLVADSEVDIKAELLKGFSSDGDSSSPLFIRMRAAQIRNSASEQERGVLLGARTNEEFLDMMFEQLEQKLGARFMHEAMALLWGSRGGLLAEELRRLTESDTQRIDALLDTADHYLVEQDGLWSFVHKRIREAVERRYVGKTVHGREIHRRLARYFAAEPVSARRAEEEPWQWEQAGDRRELAACLADMEMFMCMSEEDRRYELRGYWLRLDDESLMVESYARSFERWSADGDVPSERRGTVAERLGTFFRASGLTVAAEQHLRLALRLFAASPGESRLKAAHAMHSTAELLRITGEFAEAEGLYREGLAILERELPPDAPAIAQILNDMGLLCRDAGRHGSALPFYQRALDLKERIHGADHPATAELLNDLALLYQDLHDFSRAIPLYERALRIRERRLGPMHPATATTLNNLAGALYHDGDLDAAESHYRRALDITEKMLGRDHLTTRVTASNLASIFQKQKKFAEARAIFERMTTGTRLGEDHPDMIATRIAHAQMLAEEGKYQEAEELSRGILDTALRRLGPSHQYTGYCYNNFANLLRRMGREPESAPLLEGAIGAWKASLGPDHPNVSTALQTLAIVRLREGDPEQARRMLHEAIAIREKHFGPEHESTRQTRELLKRVDG